MTRTILALLLAAPGAAAHGQGLTSPPPDGSPPSMPAETRSRPETSPAAAATADSPAQRGSVLAEVSGVVQDVDRKANRIAVESGNGRVTLQLDRNTMVYTAGGLGTVRDVFPGAQIRAGRNAEFLAYWVQVRAPAEKGEAPPAPGQGTGPAGGAGAPATESGAPGVPGPGAGPPAPTSPPSGTPGAGPGPGTPAPRVSPGG